MVKKLAGYQMPTMQDAEIQWLHKGFTHNPLVMSSTLTIQASQIRLLLMVDKNLFAVPAFEPVMRTVVIGMNDKYEEIGHDGKSLKEDIQQDKCQRKDFHLG